MKGILKTSKNEKSFASEAIIVKKRTKSGHKKWRWYILPRLSKREKEEWAFFIDEKTGRRTYNDKCRKCIHECKQSFRAVIVNCPNYKSKRSDNNTEEIKPD